MSLLKSLASSIDNENVMEDKKRRQLRTNPFSKPFGMNFPVIERDCSDKELQKRIIDECHSIGDVQGNQTNVHANMTSWFMHETNDDFMSLCDIASDIADDNSPSKVLLMPYDCWGAVYHKNDFSKSHDHWPSIWSWVYNVECCDDCAPLQFDDANISVRPKNGNMVMFPGWVKHSVPKHQCDHERIIVAGNLGLNPWWMVNRLDVQRQEVSEKYKNIAELGRKELTKLQNTK